MTAPTPLAPAMGAALDASAASFSWTAVPGATHRLQISRTPGFAAPLLDIEAGLVAEITLTDALQPTTEARFWRVGAMEASGETAWSRPRPFSLPAPAALAGVRATAEHARPSAAARAPRGLPVIPEPPPPPVLPALPTGATISGGPSATHWRRVPGVATPSDEAASAIGPPRPLGPLAGAITDGGAATFRWTAVPGAAGYEIEIGPDLSGPTLRLNAGKATELALGGVLPSAGDRLFWRVRARTEAGPGPWSKYGRFYAGTDLQAMAYHDRQAAERAYARRVQEHEERVREAELDLIAPCDRPIDPDDHLGYTFAMAMLFVGIVMVLGAAIGGLVL